MPATEPPTTDPPDGEDVALVAAQSRLRMLARRVQADEAPIVDLAPLTDEEEIRRERAQGSLYWFVREFFETIDSHPYVDNWHIGAISEHLQAVQIGQIRRLLINMPVRHMKSLQVSALFPAWIWVDTPWQKFIVGHHSLALGKDLAEKNRDILRSPKFQRWYGHRVALRSDSNAIERFRSDKGGLRRMTSVGSGITGEGGDYTIIDDPHDTQTAESDLVRQSTVNWGTKTMFSRVESMKDARRIITGQRVHPYDLSNAVLEHGGWVHLNLPAEYVPDRKCRVFLDGALFPDRPEAEPGKPFLFFEDPRTEKDQVLWPGHVDKPELALLKQSLGRMYSAYMQQDPLPPEGAMFQRQDWVKVRPEHLPKDLRWVRSWDLASSEVAPGKQPDYSSGALIGKSPETRIRYLTNIVLKQESARTMMDVIVRTAKRDGREVPVVFEIEGGSAGEYLLLYLREKLDGYVVIGKRSTKSKVIRAEPVANQAGNGMWRVVDDSGLKPDRRWNEAYLQQIEVFPMGPHDDMVDSVSLGSQYLDGKEKGAGVNMSRAHQFVSATEIISFCGKDSQSRFDKQVWVPPDRWNICMAVAFDELDERDGAALYIATPNASHELAGISVVFRLVTIPAGSAPAAVINLLEHGEFEYGKQITRRLVGPEATKLQEAFSRRYKRRFATWEKDPRAGFAQARDALEIERDKPHPVFEVDDVPMQGRPRILFVVHDAQVSRSWDERGLKSLVQGLEQYTAGDDKGAMVAREYPALRAFLGICSVWFASAEPMSRNEEIESRLPDGLADVAGEAPLPGYSRSIALDLYRAEVERQLDEETMDPRQFRRRRIG